MKTLQIRWFHIGLYILLSIVTGCRYKGLPSNTLYSTTLGYWEWVSTTTPSKIITPQTAGYTKQMRQWVYSNVRGSRDITYLNLYKNDTLQRRYSQTDVSNIADDVRNTIIIKYDTIGYLKWYITPNSTYIQISEFRDPYSLAADTIRNLYKYNPDLKATLFPY